MTEVSPPELDRFLLGCIGSLAKTAAPILRAGAAMRDKPVADINVVRRELKDQIRDFQRRIREGNVSKDTEFEAISALCFAMEDAMAGFQWADLSNWTTLPLPMTFTGHAHGEDRFLRRVEQSINDSGQDIDLMELDYACLSFDIKSDYRFFRVSPAQLLVMRQNLYERIVALRAAS